MIGSQESKFRRFTCPIMTLRLRAGSPHRCLYAELRKQSTTQSGEFLAPTNENVPAKNLEPMKVTSKEVHHVREQARRRELRHHRHPGDKNLEFGVTGGFSS